MIKELLLRDAEQFIKQEFGDDRESALIELVRVYRLLQRLKLTNEMEQ